MFSVKADKVTLPVSSEEADVEKAGRNKLYGFFLSELSSAEFLLNRRGFCFTGQMIGVEIIPIVLIPSILDSRCHCGREWENSGEFLFFLKTTVAGSLNSCRSVCSKSHS